MSLHMCNLHIKETEISQKRSKGIKNWTITYSVILSVLSNKSNLILGFSSPLRRVKLHTFSELPTLVCNFTRLGKPEVCKITHIFLHTFKLVHTFLPKTHLCPKHTCSFYIPYLILHTFQFYTVSCHLMATRG